MKKITDIETLKVFEAHELAKSNAKILVWNVLTKEVYYSLKRKVKDSERKYGKMFEKEEKGMIAVGASVHLNTLMSQFKERQKARAQEIENEKTFYTKRITERNTYQTDVLLAADLLPETLLRDIYLKNADNFILIRSGDIYVGVLSKIFSGGYLSVLNGDNSEVDPEETIISMMSSFTGGGNKW